MGSGKEKVFARLCFFKLSNKLYGYLAAYRYIIKEKDISTVLHSQGHTPLECMRSPKTKKTSDRFRQVSSEKKKKLEKNICAKPVRLTNVDVSNLMVRQGIKREDELLSMGTCAGWRARFAKLCFK